MFGPEKRMFFGLFCANFVTDMRLRLFGAFLLVFWTGFLGAQKISNGSFLVQLKPGSDFGVFREKCGFGIANVTTIDKGFGIYLIEPNAQSVIYQDPSLWEKSGLLLSHQTLNEVKNRGLLPNDPLLTQQKYLDIIRAADVWPYQRGGVTRRGDTIVIAIVDSGMDTLHPDLIHNYWVNHHEIPGNKKDDDNNGYVDDVHGWNGGDSNARMYTAVTLDGHGNAIAGIIGAEGDNAKGISGLNWNVKIMPVICYAEQGSGSDIGVIRSLIYVYRMKKMYLESNGTKGANIVAVNTSVGIDRAFPVDAPIWCSLYDSLGAVGILSASATTNNNYDVGVKGDIPSTCPSNYKIVVSNTSLTDTRVNSGFSSKFVDMGAPGEKIFSTALVRNAGSNGPYAEFNGTSFSTPMVTATIGLLYQSVCDTFLSLTIQNPDSAMRLLKSWVMEGGKSLSVLSGNTVSGKRLDMYGTWKLMDDWCRAHDNVYSTKENFEGLGVNIFPNPVRQGDGVTLTLPSQSLLQSFELTDIEGRSISVDFSHQNQSLKIETAGLAPGTYLIHLQLNESQLVRKLQVY